MWNFKKVLLQLLRSKVLSVACPVLKTNSGVQQEYIMWQLPDMAFRKFSIQRLGLGDAHLPFDWTGPWFLGGKCLVHFWGIRCIMTCDMVDIRLALRVFT